MVLGLKAYLRYQYDRFNGKYAPTFQGGYEDWRAKRTKAILDHYGHELFNGKSLLELGAGFGDIGHFFSMIGSKVTCLDARAKNTKATMKRFPSLKAITFDLNNGLPNGDKFDIIIHFGVLYHLRTPDASLRESCKACEYLILETECSDSDDPHYLPEAKETSFVYDQAIDGIGTRPSQAYVERILKEEGMTFERITDGRCNAAGHFYDWPLKNTKQCPRGQRRMWFAKHG